MAYGGSGMMLSREEPGMSEPWGFAGDVGPIGPEVCSEELPDHLHRDQSHVELAAGAQSLPGSSQGEQPVLSRL